MGLTNRRCPFGVPAGERGHTDRRFEATAFAPGPTAGGPVEVALCPKSPAYIIRSPVDGQSEIVFFRKKKNPIHGLIFHLTGTSPARHHTPFEARLPPRPPKAPQTPHVYFRPRTRLGLPGGRQPAVPPAWGSSAWGTSACPWRGHSPRAASRSSALTPTRGRSLGSGGETATSEASHPPPSGPCKLGGSTPPTKSTAWASPTPSCFACRPR